MHIGKEREEEDKDTWKGREWGEKHKQGMDRRREKDKSGCFEKQ